jgi:hypothetical protein
MTMTLIETKTLGTAAASIEFTSIPQDGTDLVVLCSVRVDVDSIALNIRFNGDTGSNFTMRILRGNGSSALSETSTSSALDSSGSNNSSATANTFSNGTLYIPNYTGSTAKSVSMDSVTENNATQAFQTIHAGIWTGTAAITSILFGRFAGGNLVAGSTISLYKVTKGSDGIVTTS